MIPKTIHYVWLGNKPKPKKIQKCIASWQKFCPDYEIKEWNETNFDIESHPFVKEAYEANNYAFASDVIRLVVLFEYGGIYVDADVEFLKPIDDLLNNEAFIGFELPEYVNSGQIFGAEKNSKIVVDNLNIYDDLRFDSVDDINTITCSKLMTKMLIEKGLKLGGTEQIIESLHIYPIDYFNPFDRRTGKLCKTNNSYSIHWSAHSWSTQNQLRWKLIRLCHRLFGVNCFDWLNRVLGR